MAFLSRKKTYDSYTPSVSSSRTSVNGALYRRSSKESQSTVGTIREARSLRSSTATSTSKQEIRSLNVTSFENEDEGPLPSTLRSSVYDLSTLPEPSSSSSLPPSTPLGDPLTKPYGDAQPFANTEIPTADNPPASHPSSLPPPTDRMGTTSLSHTVPSSKEDTSSSASGMATNHDVYDTSSPSARSSRRTSQIAVEHHKLSRKSIEEYQELLNIHAAAASGYRDPFVPSTGERATSAVYTTPPAARSVAVTSFSPRPVSRISTVSRSRSGTVTAKSKKGMFGFMTKFFKSHKRPEISMPYDPVHLTHVRFNSSTGEFTGLPKEWQQLLQDSGISKSDQEKNPLAVMEIVKFYQEGGGDVWDKMGHTPAPGGSSQSPPIPGTAHPAFPGLSKSVDDSFVSTVSLSNTPHSRILNVQLHSGGVWL